MLIYSSPLKSLIERIINGSIFILLLRKLLVECSTFWFLLERALVESRVYKMITILWAGTRLNFENCFLGKITEINETINFDILGSSNVVRRLTKVFNYCRYRIINYCRESLIISSIRRLYVNFYFLPLKTAGVFVIIAIIVNAAASIFLKNGIGLMGWSLRAIFLFVAVNGLSSRVSWEELAETSYFMRRLNNPCKIQD